MSKIFAISKIKSQRFLRFLRLNRWWILANSSLFHIFVHFSSHNFPTYPIPRIVLHHILNTMVWFSFPILLLNTTLPCASCLIAFISRCFHSFLRLEW